MNTLLVARLAATVISSEGPLSVSTSVAYFAAAAEEHQAERCAGHENEEAGRLADFDASDRDREARREAGKEPGLRWPGTQARRRW